MRLLLAALGIAGLLVSGTAKADKRVAFVVGNGAYRNVVQLRTPSMDAKAMAIALRSIGFDVVEGTDLTSGEMTERLLDFGKKAKGADIAVFFYAGHSMPLMGTNYLLPVDADIRSEMDVNGSVINIDLALDRTMNDAKVRLVFLDACRENPFADKIRASRFTRNYAVQSGLVAMKSSEGTLIVFAAQPEQFALDGPEGTHSPFTRALIDNITQPGVEIEQAISKVRFQVRDQTNTSQIPWEHTNLIDPLYLNPAPVSTTSAAPNTPTTAAPSAASANSGLR
jgi:uncharacterized caspase-like protein